MASKEVKLKTIEGKNYVDVDESVKAIKKQLQNTKTILIVARGIEISRVAIVIRRVEEECNCIIAKMNVVNKKEADENNRQRSVMEFHAKLLKKE